MEEELKRLNAFFGAAMDVQLITQFTKSNDQNGPILAARIQLLRKAQEFPFTIEVPENFPLYGMRFYYQGNQIASHLLRGGLVCADSPFSDSFNQKMHADLSAIREWIDRFVLSEERTHYEYLPMERRAIFMLFDEPEGPVRLKPGDWGEFHSMKLPRGNEAVESTFMALDLGEKAASWSTHYSLVNPQKAMEYWKKLLATKVLLGQVSEPQIEAFVELAQGKEWPKDVPEITVPKIFLDHADQLAKGQKGIYCFLGAEPLDPDGKVIRTLGQLSGLLNPECKHAIQEMQAKGNGISLFDLAAAERPNFINLMLGYKIPNKDEIHWELVLYPLQEPNGTNSEKRKASQLIWGKTINNSKERFFGRGMLHAQMRDARILILGLGALGSNLAHSLVRGGATSLTISDYDHVESGNVCRSTYQFNEVHLGKDVALMFQLMRISPFVNIAIAPSFPPIFLDNHPDAAKFMEAYNSFDLIIDCTANDAVAWMLDQMQLDATVINLSISDEAKHLVAVANTGKVPILPTKRNIFSALGQAETTASFYEGAGCWHPTFQASFADINLLLQQYIADANHRLGMRKSWATTVLETIKGEFGLRVVKRDDC